MANVLPRSTYFAFILYPDNKDHMSVYHYLENHQDQFKPVWILHEAEESVEEITETDEDGNEISHSVVHAKKPHIHMMIKSFKQTTCNGIIRMFGGNIDYCLNIFSPCSYVMYMIHDTYNSRQKKQYPITDLCGDKKMIKKTYSSQNRNFVQLKEVVEAIENGASLTDVVKEVCESAIADPCADSIEMFEKFQYIIVAMATEKRFAIQRDFVSNENDKLKKIRRIS